MKTANIIEMSNLYTEAEGTWWTMNDDFPSKLRYRTFMVNEEKWNKWIEDNFEIVIKSYRARASDAKLAPTSIVAKVKNHPNVIVGWSIGTKSKENISISDLSVLYSITDKSFIPELFDEELSLYKFHEEKKSQVYMVVQRHGSLDLQSFDIEIPTMDIEMNYGPEWAKKHEELIEVFTTKKKKGIALLHGLPGTGKSMYIRHLISHLCENKTVVYLPNQLIPCITDPGFIPLMAEYSGSILVIEDADEAIKSRKTGGGTVDKLLNLADGILSDFLGMQIICTFNNDLSTIDDALLRKGRLILKHEFGKLSVQSAQKLSDKLGFETTIEDPMTLAEIYNQEDKLSDIEKKDNKIGFR
jgi:hypothetical protein